MTKVCTRQEGGRDQRQLMMAFYSRPLHDFVSKASACVHMHTRTYPNSNHSVQSVDWNKNFYENWIPRVIEFCNKGLIVASHHDY